MKDKTKELNENDLINQRNATKQGEQWQKAQNAEKCW